MVYFLLPPDKPAGTFLWNRLSKSGVLGSIISKTSILNFPRINWLSLREYPEVAKVLWLLTRFMQKDKEDMWKVFLPMPDSFWELWKNLRWSLLRAFHRQSQLT